MEGQSVTRSMNKQIIRTLLGFVLLTDRHLLGWEETSGDLRRPHSHFKCGSTS